MIPEFLSAVWGATPLGSWGEIRTIQDGRIHQRYIPAVDPWQAEDIALVEGAEGRDVYYGVLPRLRQEGTNDAVPDMVRVLWADVDAKKVSDVMAVGKAQALVTINSFPVPPQLLVDSGGGYHCYWLLREPAPYAVAQPVMRWIATVLNGDFVQDKARILRLPGTTNWKRVPVPARLLRFDITRDTRIDDLVGQMPVERDRRPFDPARRVRVANLPDWLDELINEGAPQGARSEACFRACVWLLRYGRTPEEIREIFRSYPDGIGAKYADKPAWDADRWLDYTLRAAEAVA